MEDLEIVGAVEEHLLQLGVGFAFIGRRYAIAVEGADLCADLLFFHLRLRRLVAIDIQRDATREDLAVRMKAYLAALDALVRHGDDGPSVGILVGRTKDRITVEYANRNWTGRLPRAWSGSLPAPEDFEELLGRRA